MAPKNSIEAAYHTSLMMSMIDFGNIIGFTLFISEFTGTWHKQNTVIVEENGGVNFVSELLVPYIEEIAIALDKNESFYDHLVTLAARRAFNTADDKEQATLLQYFMSKALEDGKYNGDAELLAKVVVATSTQAIADHEMLESIAGSVK